MADRLATWTDITRSSEAALKLAPRPHPNLPARYSHCTSNKLTRPQCAMISAGNRWSLYDTAHDDPSGCVSTPRSSTSAAPITNLTMPEQGLRPAEIAHKLGVSTYTVTQIILSAKNRAKG